MISRINLLLFFVFLVHANCLNIDSLDFDNMHPKPQPQIKKLGGESAVGGGEGTQTENTWWKKGQAILKKQLTKNIDQNQAKNIILFIGDGMSIPTFMATRVSLGNEDKELSFEKFPYVGLSKTYCENHQVPDSACTATAYCTGIKANLGTMGVNSNVKFGDCYTDTIPENQVESIAAWAQKSGKSTGLITTTTVTHASPGGIYAHTGNRMWESNREVQESKCNDLITPDIAEQLIRGKVGSKLDVIMGGGRRNFLPNTLYDEQGILGYRTDRTNLIAEWRSKNPESSTKYIYSRTGLMNLPADTKKVLGLFSSSHFPFKVQNNREIPRLYEMVDKAVKILSQNPKGFFLFVEGGEIDFGHHGNNPQIALTETAELSLAVEQARTMTSEADTLIVVTSDHSHTMSISGYPARGNNIYGPVLPMTMFGEPNTPDGLPLSTLSYANGPGYYSHLDPVTKGRKDIRRMDFATNVNYQSPATVPLQSETHGGDDVAIFASGPGAYLFSGVVEQNFIPHGMAYAACIGKGRTTCNSRS